MILEIRTKKFGRHVKVASALLLNTLNLRTGKLSLPPFNSPSMNFVTNAEFDSEFLNNPAEGVPTI